MAESHTETESTFPHVKVAFDDFVITGIFSTIMNMSQELKHGEFMLLHLLWVYYLIFRCSKETELPTSNSKPQISGWKGMDIHSS